MLDEIADIVELGVYEHRIMGSTVVLIKLIERVELGWVHCPKSG